MSSLAVAAPIANGNTGANAPQPTTNSGDIRRDAIEGNNEKYQLALGEVHLSSGVGNPIDRLLAAYFQLHSIDPANTISDERFARRVALDLIGQPLTEAQLNEFIVDHRPGKRSELVKRLLADHENYVGHWMTFWSDHLRIGSDVAAGIFDNDETKAPQIWLKKELERDVPVDRLVYDLLASDSVDNYAKSVAPAGEVASRVDVPEMQLATTISQVFLGIQLKCASCHDSFVDRWQMKDAWGLAAALSNEPFEIYRCDIATHQKAIPRFPLVELGTIDPRADVQARRRQVAAMLTKHENGLFARTIVNRIWQRMFGRGLIEPLDEMMEHQPWNSELLDWLAGELIRQKYDVKRILEVIATSRAYQLPSVVRRKPIDSGAYVFRGPEIRRITAEQFLDSLRQLQISQNSKEVSTIQKDTPRAWQLENNRLMTMLGRPSRDVVTTSRNNEPTPLMALELINGGKLEEMVDAGASVQLKCAGGPSASGGHIFKMLLGRDPTPRERALIANVLGPVPTKKTVSDLIWAVAMLPEFQLIQ